MTAGSTAKLRMTEKLTRIDRGLIAWNIPTTSTSEPTAVAVAPPR